MIQQFGPSHGHQTEITWHLRPTILQLGFGNGRIGINGSLCTSSRATQEAYTLLVGMERGLPQTAWGGSQAREVMES